MIFVSKRLASTLATDFEGIISRKKILVVGLEGRHSVRRSVRQGNRDRRLTVSLVRVKTQVVADFAVVCLDVRVEGGVKRDVVVDRHANALAALAETDGVPDCPKGFCGLDADVLGVIYYPSSP